MQTEYALPVPPVQYDPLQLLANASRTAGHSGHRPYLVPARPTARCLSDRPSMACPADRTRARN